MIGSSIFALAAALPLAMEPTAESTAGPALVSASDAVVESV